MALPSKLQWVAPEYEYHEKSTDWYWALGIICVAGIVAAVIFKNHIFATFIAFAGIVLAYFSTRKPELIEYEINQRGIKIKDRLYPFMNIEAFWVEDRTTTAPQLFIRSDRALIPQMVIPLGDEMPPELVHDYLLEFLPEKEMRESTTHHVMEFFGF